MHFRSILRLAICLVACISANLHAQVVSQPAGTQPQLPIQFFSAEPFNALGSLNTVSGAIKTIASADGTRFYTLTRVNDPGLLVIPANNPTTATNVRLGDLPVDMVLSPTGSKLVIFLQNTVVIYDTESGALTDLGATGNVGARPQQVAFSEDGTRAFFVSSDSLRVTKVNLSNNAVEGFVNLPFGLTTGAVSAPNGRVYVTARNRIFEIDGASMALTGQEALNGDPARPAVTSDGRYLVAVNNLPITGASSYVYELANKRLVSVLRPTNFEAIADVTLVSNTRAVARGLTTGSIYDINIPSATIQQLQAASFLGSASSIAVSDEVPARYLFAYTSGGLQRLDLSTAQASWSEPRPQPTPVGVVSYAAGLSQGPVARFETFTERITGAPNQRLSEILVRALDARGRPVPNAPITFNPNNSQLSVETASPTTNAQGFARAIFRAPNNPVEGTLRVQSGNATPLEIPVTITAGGTDNSGRPGPGIFIVRGTGLALLQNQQARILPTVLVRDDNGNPLEDAEVTFQVTEGPAGLLAPIGGDPGVNGKGCRAETGAQAVCRTDSTGQASVSIRGGNVTDGSSFRSVRVTATSGKYTATFRMAIIAFTQAAYPLVEVLAPEQVVDAQGFISGTVTVPANGLAENAIRIRFRSNAVGGGQDGRPMPNVGFRVFDDGDSRTVCDAEGGVAISTVAPFDPNRFGDDPNDGVASCNLRVGPTTGLRRLRVELFGEVELANAIINVNVTPPPPSAITPTQGNGTSGVPGQAVTLVAAIRTASGAPVVGAPATFTVESGPGTLSNVQGTSNERGEVSATLTLGTGTGAVVVRVRSGQLTTVFNVSLVAPVQNLRIESGNNQSAVTDENFGFPVVVRVVGPNGAGVAGQTVNFSVVSGPVSLLNSTAVTDNQGNASATVRAGSGQGTATVRASSGGFSVDFNLTVTARGINANPSNFANAFNGVTGFVCPGCIVTITARGVAPGVSGLQLTNRFFAPYPTTFNGVQVRFGGVNAPILSASNVTGNLTQTETITVQVPWEVATQGTAETIVQFVSNGVTTSTQVPVRFAYPSFPEYADGNRRIATFLDANNNVVSQLRRGQRYRVLVAGLGQTQSPQETGKLALAGQTGLAARNYVLALNKAGVPVVSVEAVPNQLGLYYVTFDIPADFATGADLAVDFRVEAQGGVSETLASRITIIP